MPDKTNQYLDFDLDFDDLNLDLDVVLNVDFLAAETWFCSFLRQGKN